jgi:MFS family permease
LIRPLGAFLFGWMGDRIGRKYTFLVTLSGMGLGTGAIGLIPTYEAIGLSAAFILFGLRMIQGLCLGGAAATTPAGCRPPQLSGSWCRCS